MVNSSSAYTPTWSGVRRGDVAPLRNTCPKQKWIADDKVIVRLLLRLNRKKEWIEKIFILSYNNKLRRIITRISFYH